MADDPVNDPSPRLFLALPFHDIFSREIGLILGRLTRRMPDVRWVRAAQIHLTLHFFGATPAAAIERIDQAMGRVAKRFSPFGVTLEKIGGFPDLKRPNVIWVGVRDQNQELESLYRAVRGEVSQLGFPVESRPFQAHVTLGRVKKKIADAESILSKPGVEFPTAVKILDRFHLYQSHCLPDGARYEILKHYAFTKAT